MPRWKMSPLRGDTGEEASTQGLECQQGELACIHLCLYMYPCVPAAIPPHCSWHGCPRCRGVPGCPQCPISGGLSCWQCAWLSPVSHARGLSCWQRAVCAARALDLRSPLKCPMETSPNLNLWGKGEEEFAAGLLPRAVCGRMGHPMAPSRPLFQGFGSLRGTRCMLMFGTNVI